jgi:hypothetical protein
LPEFGCRSEQKRRRPRGQALLVAKSLDEIELGGAACRVRPLPYAADLAGVQLRDVLEDIARILRETLSAIKGNKGRAEERDQEQRDEIVRVLTETRGRVGGGTELPPAWA